jgi:acyl transferase domain-containing protein
VSGALLAAAALTQRQLAPIVGLRQLNPYVGAALADWRARHGMAAAPSRQLGAAAHLTTPRESYGGGSNGSGSTQLAGTSSFGMSGVNAHALLSSAVLLPAAPAASASGQLPWQRGSYWPSPPPHPLLQLASLRTAASGGGWLAECGADLASARLAWLAEHSVQGRPLLPGAAMFEAAAATALACTAADGGGITAGSRSSAAICGLAILAPCLLPTPGQAAGLLLRCALNTMTGALEVSSGGGLAGGRHSMHLQGRAAASPASPASASAGGSDTSTTAAAAAAAGVLLRQLWMAAPQRAAAVPVGHNFAVVGAGRQAAAG